MSTFHWRRSSLALITILDNRNLWHRRYAFEVISWRSLWNAAHAAFSLFLTSAVSCSSNVFLVQGTVHCRFSGRTSFFFTFIWLLRIFVLLRCIPNPPKKIVKLFFPLVVQSQQKVSESQKKKRKIRYACCWLPNLLHKSQPPRTVVYVPSQMSGSTTEPQAAL